MTNPSALTVSAWTNAASSSSLNCLVDNWTGPTGGPANSDFTVTSVTNSGNLSHPGSNLGTCTASNFDKNTVATGTWTYALGGTPTNWPAGVYTTTVTYTATGI
jgi:hypothetical protein